MLIRRRSIALEASRRLEKPVAEERERLKTEMMGKVCDARSRARARARARTLACLARVRLTRETACPDERALAKDYSPLLLTLTRVSAMTSSPRRGLRCAACGGLCAAAAPVAPFAGAGLHRGRPVHQVSAVRGRRRAAAEESAGAAAGAAALRISVGRTMLSLSLPISISLQPPSSATFHTALSRLRLRRGMIWGGGVEGDGMEGDEAHPLHPSPPPPPPPRLSPICHPTPPHPTHPSLSYRVCVHGCARVRAHAWVVVGWVGGVRGGVWGWGVCGGGSSRTWATQCWASSASASTTSRPPRPAARARHHTPAAPARRGRRVGPFRATRPAATASGPAVRAVRDPRPRAARRGVDCQGRAVRARPDLPACAARR